MKNLPALTRQTYDQIAPYFAAYNGQMPAEVLQGLAEFLTYLSPKGWVLDLGCGAGRDLSWLSQQSLRLCGADFSTGMLAEARKVVSSPLVQMDLCSLGFADQVFDGLWCNAALLHLPKSEAPRALQEMRRVLRENGLLALTVQKGAGEGLEVNPYNQVGERYFARYSLEEVIGWLQETGFNVLTARPGETVGRTWLRFVARVVR